MMDDIVEPRRSPSPWLQNIRIKALGQDPAPTGWNIALEAPRLEVQVDVTPRERQVEKEALVPAVHPKRVPAAQRKG